MHGPTKPIAAYLRVSTADQSHDSQRAEVARWLDREGFRPELVEWYEDVESGRKASRPQFDRLKADVQAGRVRTVVVFKLDRISRDLFDGMEVLGRWCKAGVRICSVTQSIDLAGKPGQIVAAVLLGMAEIEWSDRRERQAAGIAVARTRGVYKGREKGSTKARPDRARELKARGLTGPEIANALGISLRSVFRYLGQPAEA